jgi:hypothetical protein
MAGPVSPPACCSLGCQTANMCAQRMMSRFPAPTPPVLGKTATQAPMHQGAEQDGRQRWVFPTEDGHKKRRPQIALCRTETIQGRLTE